MSWRERAACRGMTDVFFDRARQAEAAAVCRACPVWAECDGEVGPYDVGVWAGRVRRGALPPDPTVPPPRCVVCARLVPRGRGRPAAVCSPACKRERDRRWEEGRSERRSSGRSGSA